MLPLPSASPVTWCTCSNLSVPGAAGDYGTRILGTRSRYLQVGSSLLLECVVTYTTHPPPALLWYHYDTRLDYDSPRGGIAIMVRVPRSLYGTEHVLWYARLMSLLLYGTAYPYMVPHVCSREREREKESMPS